MTENITVYGLDTVNSNLPSTLYMSCRPNVSTYYYDDHWRKDAKGYDQYGGSDGRTVAFVYVNEGWVLDIFGTDYYAYGSSDLCGLLVNPFGRTLNDSTEFLDISIVQGIQ